MRAVIRLAALALVVTGAGFAPAHAQSAPPPATAPAQTSDRFTASELVDSGHKFFGSVSRGLAQVIEKAISQIDPNSLISQTSETLWNR